MVMTAHSSWNTNLLGHDTQDLPHLIIHDVLVHFKAFDLYDTCHLHDYLQFYSKRNISIWKVYLNMTMKHEILEIIVPLFSDSF